MKAVVAVVAFAAFLALGFAVRGGADPASLMTWEAGVAGHGALVAWWLTWSCYPQVLAPIAIVLLIVAWRAPAWRTRIVFSIVMLLLCWQAADLFQHVFARPRRLDWIVRRETAFSYPSSHAAIATGFYLLWAAMLSASGMRRAARVASALLLVLLAAGVCWARLALAAHYLSDIVGGVLLAVAIVAAALAVFPVKGFAPPSGV